MIEQTWESSCSWPEAMRRCYEQVDGWITESIARQREQPWQGGHDEGTFTTPWCGFYWISRQPRIIEFVKWMRDGYAAWAEAHPEKISHGYPVSGETHHAPECHLYFLSRVWSLDPEDRRSVELLKDCAHHVGNWADGVPKWFDWDESLFVGHLLGSKEVDTQPPNDINVVDNCRLATICLTTYRATGNERYLDIACRIMRRWAEAVLDESTPIPLALHPWLSTAELEAGYSKARSASFGAAPSDVQEKINRIEGHVSAGSIDTFLDLFRVTQDETFLAAARELLEPLIGVLADPYAQPAGALLGKYRLWTGATDWDDRIAASAGPSNFPDLATVGMEANAKWEPHDLMGIGKRTDMLRWTHTDSNGQTVTLDPPPASLCLAWQISGEDAYLLRALDLAAVRMSLAHQALPDGRRHGCGSRSISSVARGHGRENNWGNVTAAYYPAALGMYDFCGVPEPLMRPRVSPPDSQCELASRVTAKDPTAPIAELTRSEGVDAPIEVAVDVAGQPGTSTSIPPRDTRVERLPRI